MATETLERSGKVAVIGLGSMGLGMARSLLKAGFDVTGCDLSEKGAGQSPAGRRARLFDAGRGRARCPFGRLGRR